MKPCQHNQPLEGCRVCFLYETAPEYRKLWGGEVPSPTPQERVLSCIHLGQLIQRAHCICRRQDIYQCDKGHGQVSQATVCESCPDYEPEE